MNAGKFAVPSKTFPVLFCLGIVAITLLLTVFYVSQEHTFYSWDYARYANRVGILATTLKTNPLEALLSIINSLGDDYSLLPVLPLLPFTLIFGDGRLVFVLALALSYIVPFCLLMGAFATQVLQRGRPKTIFWTTAFTTLLVPPTWFPIFRGYPDLGGMCLVLWGMTLYWKEVALQRQTQILKIAGVLALAVYFRRHFAYSVRAFLLAVVLYHLAIALPQLLQHPRAKLPGLFKFYRQVILLALYFGLFGIIIFVKTFFINYRLLYAAYEVSPAENLQYFGSAFGWVLWGMAIVGYGIGIKRRSFAGPKIGFFLLFSGISILQWLIVSKQTGPHYTAHFIPLVILGISTLIVELLNTPQTLQKVGWTSGNSILLGFNLVLALVPNSKASYPLRSLFATHEAPLVRKDYQPFAQLIKLLRDQTPNGEPIYIAASSYSLNSSNVLNAEQQLYGAGRLSIFKTSDVDSRDYYPLNALLSSDYVVVANPPQFHLAAREQDLVRVVVDAFNENWRFTKDFQKLPAQFKLDGGLSVEVYQRIRKTSEETIVQTLQRLLARVSDKPGREPYWLTLNSAAGVTGVKGVVAGEDQGENLLENQPQRYKEHRYSNIQKDPLVNTVHISGIALVKGVEKSFLYFGNIPKTGQLVGMVNRSKCKELKTLSLRLTALQSENVLPQVQQLTLDLDRSKDFQIQLPASGATYLQLTVLAPDVQQKIQAQSCVISLNHVTFKE